MKKIFAVVLAVVMVLGISSVSFAVIGSPVGSTVEGGGSGNPVTSPALQERVKNDVARETGVDAASITSYGTAKMSVGNYKDSTYRVSLNMPAALNGQVVKVAVLGADGTYKILEATVENGRVSFDGEVVNGVITFMVYTDNVKVNG